ncbi:MAG: helix-turn-helix domain-containing protein [Spirochaetota bacterium]
MASLTKRLVPLLRSFTVLSRHPVIYKPGDVQYDASVPQEYYTHTCAFCSQVKKIGQSRRCIADDIDAVIVRAQKTRVPFIKTCHANVAELVVPVFGANGYDGAFFFGPFRMKGALPRYPRTAAAFRSLSPVDARVFAAARTALTLLGVYTARERDMIDLRERTRGITNPKIVKAMQAIESTIAGAVRVEAVAKSTGVSPSRFVHLFKEKTGMTFTDYVIARKMERAKRLLEASSLSVTDIAFECGYANQSYFSSAFRKATGTTPKAYQKQNAKRLTP